MPLQRLDDFNVLDTDTGVVSYIPVTNQGRVAPGAPTSGPPEIGDELLYPTRKLMPSPGSLPTSDLPASPDRDLTPPPPGTLPVAPGPAGEDRAVDPLTGAPVPSLDQLQEYERKVPVRPPPGPKDALYEGMISDSAQVLDQKAKAGEAQLAHEQALAATQAAGQEEEAGITRQFIADSYNSRQTALAKSEARWDMFNRDMKEKLDQKVDPSHWFASRSIWQKIAATLSVAAGSLITGGGKNPGLEIIQQYIKDDIAAQRDNIQTGIAGLRMKEAAAERGDARDLQGMENESKDYLLKLEAVRKEVLARNSRLDQTSGTSAKYQQLYADLGALGADMANSVRQMQMADEDTKANRAFQDEQRRKSEAAVAARQREAQRHSEAMAQAERAAKAQPAGPAWDPDTALAADNFVVTDESGQEVQFGPEGIPFSHREPRAQAAKKIGEAQAITNAIEELKHQVQTNSSFLDDALSNADRTAALENAIQVSVMAGERGAPSDMDKERYEKIIRGFTGSWLNEGVKPGDVEKILDRRMAETVDRVNTDLNSLKDPRMTGKKISWKRRPYVRLEEPGEPTLGERTATDIGLAPGAVDTRKPKTGAQIQAEKVVAEQKGAGAKGAYDTVEALGQRAAQGDQEALKALDETYRQGFKKTKYIRPDGEKVNVGTRAGLHVRRAEAIAAIARATSGTPYKNSVGADRLTTEFDGKLRSVGEIRKLLKQYEELLDVTKHTPGDRLDVDDLGGVDREVTPKRGYDPAQPVKQPKDVF